MKIAYALLYPGEEENSNQMRALRATDPVDIIVDTLNGSAPKRRNRTRMLRELKRGSRLAVERGERLVDSVDELFDLIFILRETECSLVFIAEGLTFNGESAIELGLVKSLKTDLAKRSRRFSLSRFRANGGRAGRKSVVDEQKLLQAKMLFNQGTPIPEVAAIIGCSKRTAGRIKNGEHVSCMHR
jgi:DNA invertase Pin-like site-specific DNA recombinase